MGETVFFQRRAYQLIIYCQTVSQVYAYTSSIIQTEYVISIYPYTYIYTHVIMNEKEALILKRRKERRKWCNYTMIILKDKRVSAIIRKGCREESRDQIQDKEAEIRDAVLSTSKIQEGAISQEMQLEFFLLLLIRPLNLFKQSFNLKSLTFPPSTFLYLHGLWFTPIFSVF